MGVAFALQEQEEQDAAMAQNMTVYRGLGNGRVWYPAFSFSSEQGLVFLGTGDDNPPRYVFERDERLQPESGSSVSERDVTIVQRSGVSNHFAAERVIERLRTSGTLAAGSMVALVGLRFDFQDLDAMPCVGLELPGDHGELIVGPAPSKGELSTYLQPRWCVVHAKNSRRCRRMLSSSGSDCRQEGFCQLSSTQLSRRFVKLVSPSWSGSDVDVTISHLTSRLVAYSTSVMFAVFDNGQVAVIAMHASDDEDFDSYDNDEEIAVDRSFEDSVVFNVLQLGDTSAYAAAAAAAEWAELCKSHVWLPTASSAVLRFALDAGTA
ncbi:hypothetical protein LPJ56_006449 [Coemansia sp. RSA 2599]|nr:hypothetical protein LPJ56_006449 [Coemansia sp. RSA 2599]